MFSPPRHSPARVAALLAAALLLTGLLAPGLLASELASAQGPDTGSPFVDAPLDVEALKAPPDRAFEVLILAFGVFLLVPIAAAAFLGLARLRQLEDQLTKELRAVRDGLAALDGGAPTGATLESATDRVEGALVRVRETIERTAAEATATASDADDTARIVRAVETLREAQAQAAHESVQRLDALVAEVRATAALAAPSARPDDSASGPAAAAGARERAEDGSDGPPVDEASDPAGRHEAAREAAVQRVRERLAASGFTAVEVVTQPDEISPEVLQAGHLVVEARRGSSVHKGRVTLQNGIPIDVQLQPGHGMFP